MASGKLNIVSVRSLIAAGANRGVLVGRDYDVIHEYSGHQETEDRRLVRLNLRCKRATTQLVTPNREAAQEYPRNVTLIGSHDKAPALPGTYLREIVLGFQ